MHTGLISREGARFNSRRRYNISSKRLYTEADIDLSMVRVGAYVRRPLKRRKNVKPEVYKDGLRNMYKEMFGVSPPSAMSVKKMEKILDAQRQGTASRRFDIGVLRNPIHADTLGLKTHYSRECPGDCARDNYCRDNKIVDLRIEGKTVNLISVADDLTRGSTDEIFKYFVERVLVNSKANEKDYWNSEISGGYYGEEFNGLKLDHGVREEIASAVNKETNAPGNRLVEEALLAEYGHLLPGLKNLDWSVEEIDRSTIKVPQDEYYKKMKKETLEFYGKDYKNPRAVVVAEDGKFKMVDGYHRLAATTDAKVKVIVGRKRSV